MSLRSLAIIVLAVFTAHISYAQAQKTGSLSGKLLDGSKKPVPYATVTLLRADNTVVNGDLSKDDGSFHIEPTGAGTFTLKITGIGLKEKTVGNITITEDKPDKKLGSIALESSAATTLQEVQVTGERNMMEMSVDKKVFNVEKNITATGGSATDVLQNVPSVSVDVDGNVALRGKGDVTILIDGKPATMLGGDVASALQSLPASSISNVEVITNPSAKYDAQGMSGIINIVTKKDRKMGFNGTASLGAGTRDKYNGSLGLNMRNNKWNVFLNSSFRKNRNHNSNTVMRTNDFDDEHYLSDEESIRSFGGFFNTIGAEYTIDDRNSITLTENLNKMTWGGEGNTTFRTYSGSTVDSTMRRYSENTGGPFSTSTALDYKHKFAKPKQELTTNVTYVKTWVERTQDYDTRNYQGEDILINEPIIQHAPGSGTTSSLNAQADYTMPFLKNARLDAGWKSQLYWFESTNTPTVDSGNGEVVDTRLLVDYDYTQQIHAVYANIANQYKNWSYQLGLRGEYAAYEGTAGNLDNEKYSYDYLGLFPSVFVSYKLPKDQSIYLNYSRRTNRPGFMQLIPIVDISDPQEIRMGNPDLVPEFIHNVELNYSKQFQKGHNLIVSTYYQYTENMIERYRVPFPDGTSFSQPLNLDHGATLGVELIGKAQILPIWDMTLSGNFFHNTIDGTNVDPTLNVKTNSWFGKFNTNLRLPHGFSLQVNGNYEGPKAVAQGQLEDAYWIDAALRKNLWKGKANIVLNVSDIFNTRKYTTIYDFGTSMQTNYRDRETRIGNITFTYRFGSNDAKAPQGRKRGQQNNNNNAPVPEKDRNNLKTEDGGEQGGF